MIQLLIVIVVVVVVVVVVGVIVIGSNSKTYISFSHEGHNERLILEPCREVEIRWKIARPLQKSSWWSSNQSENETKER